MASLLVVGVAVVDFVFVLDELPTSAEKYRTEQAVIVGGGCAANAAVAAVRLGGTALLAARVGDDPVGDLIVTGLDDDGVDTTLVRRGAGARSSYSSVYVDAAGERQIVNFRGAALGDDTTWVEAVPAVDAVLTDTKWTAGAIAALQLARERGVPGIVDGEPPIDPGVLQLASHVALSLRGAQSLTSTTDAVEALERCSDRIPGWTCVTDGANGVHVAGPDSIEHVPAFPVDVVDTLGAGDVWHGAFALRLTEGADEIEAARFANAVAALKCANGAGRSGCPDRAEVEAFLAGRQAGSAA